MREKTFKSLQIIVSLAIIACHLAESIQDIKKGDDSRIENIENWLTNVNEELIERRKPEPLQENTSSSSVDEGVLDIKKGDDSRIEVIENWITKVNEEEIERRKPDPLQDDSQTSSSSVDEGVLDDVDYDNVQSLTDYSIYSSYDDDYSDEVDYDYSFYDPFWKWYVNLTHEAAKRLNENKDILETHNKTALRLLHLYSIAGALYYSEPKKREELREAEEEDLYSNFLEAIDDASKTCPQRPRVYQLDLKPQDCSVLKCIWESWHNEVGMTVRDDFRKVVELSNGAAKENGYNDAGEVWKIDEVEDINAENEMKRLLDGVMPLYKQLHAYVRRKVFSYYSNDNSCYNQSGPDDPIPAHLTGNLIGKEWSELESLVLPYPEAILPNFTELMNSLKLDQNDMAREAEKFFTSLGFQPMTEGFWKKSIFNATEDSDDGCVPRIYDNLDGSGHRIFMCASLTLKDFEFQHRCIGNVVAYMESKDLPFKFRHGLDSIIGDGLGFILMLSIYTPDHLKKTFNLSHFDQIDEPDNGSMTLSKKRDINALMSSALNMLPMLPYFYVLEMWRYKVFSGNITPEEYNRSWWKMRLRNQGIAPPSKRSDSNFDPGAISCVSHNSPCGKYFFSLIVAFQMHEALCKLTNNEPLHHCDIYQSMDAGKKLREILKQGGSKTTVELLNEMTCDEGYRFEPILEYYKPLHDWLKEQNKGHTVEWNKDFKTE